MLGHETNNKLIDLRIYLDTMTADEGCQTVWWVQCIPAHPIRPQEHRRPTNNRLYMVKNVFIEALWLEAPSHMLTLPHSVQLPTIAPITPHVLLDMVARELDRDDTDDAMKVSRASDMIKGYHQTRR
ncbi:hypothetical protein M9H77_22450 [Catharanthus roseus]|uniref:Uncharacterized protein n=1 Tax=Catharanthus roseus TaxID=4058 RepID=A0ACC0ARR1_CATRO|nr:hypothetical protein M9H77_22450 [Catharanthus roseus]